MSKQFFITGLPRSRTAWFANLFTWTDSLCYHDALCHVSKSCLTTALKSLEIKLGHDDRFKFIGHSDASNLLFWRNLNLRFPEAKWVYIDRPRRDVCNSVATITRTDSEEVGLNLREMQAMAESVCSKTKAMIVTFDSIDPVKCYEIAEYLSIDIGPAARVRQLCDFNIQIHPPILKRRLESLKCQHHVDTKEAA